MIETEEDLFWTFGDYCTKALTEFLRGHSTYEDYLRRIEGISRRTVSLWRIMFGGYKGEWIAPPAVILHRYSYDDIACLKGSEADPRGELSNR